MRCEESLDEIPRTDVDPGAGGRRDEATRRSSVVVPAKLRVPQPAALVRDRLIKALDGVWQQRIALVVAPAGSGKTTLLAQFASSVDVPVAWYRAERSEGDVASLLAHLKEALSAAIGPDPAEWDSVEDASRALERWTRERVVLVVDDLHALSGTPAEAALEQLANYAAPALHIVMSSRVPPHFNLSRLRVSGSLLELGSDDLRFRSWEVERLFCALYREPLTPEDLAELTRRTGGWAAGLQLFHLATRGKPASERRRTLAELATRSRLTREYLTMNVLHELPPELEDFLVHSCVLGRLTGPLCDELLGTTGSERLLKEIQRRQIFTAEIDEGWYRYHEVLRAHLEEVLLERVGEEELRLAFRRAGSLLETADALPEALRAYARGDDLEAAARLLHRQGEQVISDEDAWWGSLPPVLVEQDPWLILARARRHRAAGRWRAAIQDYRQAEQAFGSVVAAGVCRGERAALQDWMEPVLVAPHAGWAGALRSATCRSMVTVPREGQGEPAALGQLVAGLTALLDGHVRRAQVVLRDVAENPSAAPLVVAAAQMGAAIAGLLCGGAGDDNELEWAVDTFERQGMAVLAELGRALTSSEVGQRPRFGGVRAASQHAENAWGETLASLLDGLLALRFGSAPPVEALEEAAGWFREMRSGVLEAWSRGAVALALARSRDPRAPKRAEEAELLARATGSEGPLMLAYLALAAAKPSGSDDYAAMAESVGHRTGLCLTGTPESAPADEPSDKVKALPLDGLESPEAPPSVVLRCLGGFRLVVDGRVVDGSRVRPRARAAMHLLALQAGRLVHRETILEALWPELDPRVGTRSLQVAISSLRQLLKPGAARHAHSLLVRDGDTYRLALPLSADVDVLTFEKALRQARAARRAGDSEALTVALERALDVYAGDLLPEDGPADWVVKQRDRLRMEAVEAAQNLAELQVERGDLAAAVAACERGLVVDRYQDELWRLLVHAHEEAGQVAVATRARRAYEAMLADLGIDRVGQGRVLRGNGAHCGPEHEEPKSRGGKSVGAKGLIAAKVKTEETVYWHSGDFTKRDGSGTRLARGAGVDRLERVRPTAERHVIS